MKRTDITDIFPDATKEAIDKLMAINGSDVNGAKGELDTLRGQMTAATNELEKLKLGDGGQKDALKEAKDAIAALQTELESMKAAEKLRSIRTKVAADKNIPAELLTGETEEACAAQADAILSFARASGYPNVRDGGESGGGTKPTTREKFADWAKDNL